MVCISANVSDAQVQKILSVKFDQIGFVSFRFFSILSSTLFVSHLLPKYRTHNNLNDRTVTLITKPDPKSVFFFYSTNKFGKRRAIVCVCAFKCVFGFNSFSNCCCYQLTKKKIGIFWKLTNYTPRKRKKEIEIIDNCRQITSSQHTLYFFVFVLVIVWHAIILTLSSFFFIANNRK